LNFIKRLAVIVVTITLGVSLLGIIPVLAAAPSITGVVIAPDPAYTDSTLEATAQGWSDTDGDPEGYQWQWQKYNTVSSTWEDISGAAGSTLASSNFIKGDQIKVICTPDDGEIGIPVEATITISNSAPSITGVVLAPDPASTDSTLEATAQGWSDADDDPEDYQWQWQKYNTGSSTWEDISGATGNTLDSSNFILNDQIKVIGTPDDGTDMGDPVEATITISVLSYDAGTDIKPGSEENPINLKSRGVTPVAIYTTEGFDATTVNIETVTFGPNEAPVVHYAYEDIDDDGDIDLILHFRTQATGIAEDDTEVTLVGETDSGTVFTGTNTIKIVPSKANGAGQGNESAPGQNKEPEESTGGKATGKENAPGQNKEPGESAIGKGNI
jgi:DNA-binding transcriptional regulator of glucitol operon